MKSGLPLVVCAALIAGSGLLWSPPAAARTKCHCVSHAISRHHHHTVVRQGDAQLRDAQAHLVNLGYYNDTPDGINGSKTKTAIKAFQHDHYMRATGILDHATAKAIAAADNAAGTVNAMPSKASSYQPPDFYATHPDPYGYVNQQYADPLLPTSHVVGAGDGADNGAGRNQTLPTRYGNVGLMEENGNSPDKHYTVTVNGQPIMEADSQPSVIGVSKTYQLGDDDVIVMSAYRDEDPVCAYNTYLLVVNGSGHAVKNVGSCSRGYQAEAKHDALYITFPQTDSGSAVGATYRYEKGRLFKL